MRRRGLVAVLIAVAATLAAVLGLAVPAGAVSLDQKLAVLSTWSQTGAASQNAWLAARANQGAWTAYAFDWSTDLCSDSPDNPLGFDFRLSCARHDFGYRNYKAVGMFPANKPRIDSYFYDDLKRRCAAYNVFVRPACLALAWTYYQAVKAFGNLSAVKQSDLDRAAKLKEQGLAAQAAQTS